MAVADSLRPTLLRLAASCAARRSRGVSPHQVGLLVAIKYAPGITRRRARRARSASRPPRCRSASSRLERDGLVARTTSEADRRCIGLTLTEDGQRTLRRVRSRRTAWLASRLGSLTPTELAAVGAAVGAARAPPRARRRSRVTKAARRTFYSLRYRNYRLFFGGPDRLPDRLVDAADRARLVRPPAHALGVRRRRDGVRAVPAVHAVRAVRGRFRRPARRAPHRDRHAGGAARLGLGARLDRARRLRASRGCSTRSPSSTGTVLVLDVPSRQQLTYRMVGREDLPNAIALNSTLFNASRIFGPAIAGVVLVAGAGDLLPHRTRSASSPSCSACSRCGSRSSSRSRSSSGRRSSPARARGSRGSEGSRGCSSSSR